MCLSCSEQPSTDIRKVGPLDSQFAPAGRGKRTSKKQVVDIFLSCKIAHDTENIWLCMEISSSQHTLCIESVYKQEPGEEFDSWGAFGFPQELEHRRSLQVLVDRVIISARSINLVAPDKSPNIESLSTIRYGRYVILQRG